MPKSVIISRFSAFICKRRHFLLKADNFGIKREDLLVQHFRDGCGRSLPRAAFASKPGNLIQQQQLQRRTALVL
jgi:hypothetical protein